MFWYRRKSRLSGNWSTTKKAMKCVCRRAAVGLLATRARRNAYAKAQASVVREFRRATVSGFDLRGPVCQPRVGTGTQMVLEKRPVFHHQPMVNAGEVTRHEREPTGWTARTAE